jgi:hypothetical protein
MPQRCQSHRLSVDRVRLAAVPACSPSVSHQPGRHPHHPLTSGQQVTLKPAGQMPAVLEREVDVVELARPLQQRQMAVDVGADCLLPEAPTHLIQGHDGVRALVGIGADHDHAEQPPEDVRTTASRQAATGTPQSSRPQAPIKPRTRPTSAPPSRTSGTSHQHQAAEQGQQRNERTRPSPPSITLTRRKPSPPSRSRSPQLRAFFVVLRRQPSLARSLLINDV